jgi:uncharacterized protein (DUF433 family)
MNKQLLLISRITNNPAICGGKPTVRNMRLTVNRVLELLANDHSEEEILTSHPYLKREDIKACLYYAAKLINNEPPSEPFSAGQEQSVIIQESSSFAR